MILPENKPKDFDVTPRIIFIYGDSMSGKTYFAKQFPDPILINTDGNGAKIDTPTVFVKSINDVLDVLTELEKKQHTFKTVIFDLIEDIDTLLVQGIINSENEKIRKKDPKAQLVESLADFPFGKGFGIYNTFWKNLIMRITKLDMNIIFISHAVEKTDEKGNTFKDSALGSKSLNAVLGRCDLKIITSKLGDKYYRTCVTKREDYTTENVKDIVIKKLLLSVLSCLKIVTTNK